jgi:hypothetical protein
MSLFDQRAAIETVMDTNFPIAHPTVSYTWQNLNYDETPDNVHVVFGIRWGVSRRIAISCNDYRYNNVFYATITAPLNSGTKDMEAVANTIMSILDQAGINGMTFTEFLLTNDERFDTRYQLVVSAIFQIDSSI